jgi:hypothetical protein
MRVDVIDVHEHAVDDPRHARPLARAVARLAMTARAFVVGRGSRQHDQAVAGLHLAVREPAFVHHAAQLDEPERAGEPVERGD